MKERPNIVAQITRSANIFPHFVPNLRLATRSLTRSQNILRRAIRQSKALTAAGFTE